MCATLYARVFTHDQQTLGLQSEAMRSYIRDRGWEAVKQVKDVGSGARERPGREGLLKAARRCEVGVVVVWRLDRWGRSVADLVVMLRELTKLGVGFVSLTEALDLTTSKAMPWPACWRSSPSSSGRSYANESGRRSPRPARKADPTAARGRRR
jgi:DNA invertase Pin-like site-specific DNA recombinase